MSTIKTKSTFGNYAIELEAEVSEEQMRVLAGFGLLQLAQRSPASKAEKELGGYGKKRPDDFKRTSIDYSEKGAKVLAGFMEDIKVEVADAAGAVKEQPLAIAALVSEYVPGEGSVPKWKEEKAVVERKNGDAAQLLLLAERVGFAVEAGDVASLTVENVAFLTTIRAWVNKQKAGL